MHLTRAEVTPVDPTGRARADESMLIAGSLHLLPASSVMATRWPTAWPSPTVEATDPARAATSAADWASARTSDSRQPPVVIAAIMRRLGRMSAASTATAPR